MAHAEKKQAPKMESVPLGQLRKRVRGPDLGGELDGVGPGGGDRRDDGLPANCPVTPLGIEAKTYYFLDGLGQVIDMAARDFSQNGHFSLFGGDYKYLCWGWPSYKNTGTKKDPVWEVSNYQSQIVSADLMAACDHRGLWSPFEKIRGRGCWRGKGGELVLHCGDRIIINGRQSPPGVIGDHVYPALRLLTQPLPVVDTSSELHPGIALKLFKMWRWKRPGLDPHLLLGQMCAGFLGAALDWRPILYLYGDKGTGKSTLQELISKIMGPWRFLTTNTTAAGIYQHIKNDSIAVAVDEMEGKADNRVNQAIVALAREAASGGVMLRGGSEGKGTTFEARSSFMFSSINPPPLEPSDLSRMALLRLEPFDKDDRDPVIDAPEMAVIGRMVLRALVDGWERFKPLKEKYDEILRSQGHDGRGCATIGTLLTLQEIVLGPHADEFGVTVENRDHWEHYVERDVMAEYEDIIPNWQKCLNHLLTAPVDQWRSGSKICIGDEVHQFYHDVLGTRRADKQLELDKKLKPSDVVGGNAANPHELNRDLGSAGVKVVVLRKNKRGWWLAVPTEDPMLARLFMGSIFAGGWKSALQQAPEGDMWCAKKITINGAQRSCTMISLDYLYDRKSGLMSEKVEEDDE